MTELAKSLMQAMAIKRWVREVPQAQLGNGEYILSRDIEAAILGEGIEVTTRVELTREGFQRIVAAEGSVGFDEDLEITNVDGDRYLLKLKSN